MRRALDQIEALLGGAILIALCVVAVAQVGSRYVTDSPLAWTEELGRVLFVWLVFVGASLALKRNEHFALEVLIDLLPATPKKLARTLICILVAVFCGLLIYFGIDLARSNWDVRTPVMEMRRTWLFLAVPVGGLLMLGRTVQATIRVWCGGSAVADPAAAAVKGAAGE